jgi:hypothetical protein
MSYMKVSSALYTLLLFSPLIAQTQTYSASNFNGIYAYTISGSAVDPITGVSTFIAECGRLSADGAGHVSGNDTVMISGDLVRRSLSGTYAINPDGTGFLTLYPSWGPQLDADLVLGDNGRLLRLVITDSGSTLSGMIEAQLASGQTAPPQGYSASSVAGGYEYRIDGNAIDFWGNVTPISEVGHLILDGAGNATGTSTVSINGLVIRRTLAGTYFVNADGSGAFTLYPSWGGAIDADLFVSGNALKVDFVVTDSGSTLSGAMTAQTL